MGRLFCEAAYEAAGPQGNAHRGVLVLRAYADGRRYVFTRAPDVVRECPHCGRPYLPGCDWLGPCPWCGEHRA